MRRLSIIDVKGGAQPLFDRSKEIVLVCNGEIYNHVELRASLIKMGYEFSSKVTWKQLFIRILPMEMISFLIYKECLRLHYGMLDIKD